MRYVLAMVALLALAACDRMENFANNCARQGYGPGTPGFGLCMQVERDRADAAGMAFGNALMGFSASQAARQNGTYYYPPPQSNCTTRLVGGQYITQCF